MINHTELSEEVISSYRSALNDALLYQNNTVWICPKTYTIRPAACIGSFQAEVRSFASQDFALVYNGFPDETRPWNRSDTNGLGSIIPKHPATPFAKEWLDMLWTPFRDLKPFIVNADTVCEDGGFIFRDLKKINGRLFITFCIASRCPSEQKGIGFTYSLVRENFNLSPVDAAFFAMMYYSLDGKRFFRRVYSHGMPLAWGGPEYYSRWASGDVQPGPATFSTAAKEVFSNGNSEPAYIRNNHYSFEDAVAYMKGVHLAQAA